MPNLIGAGNWKITTTTSKTIENKKSVVTADYNIPVIKIQESVLTTHKNLVIIGYNHKVKIVINDIDYHTIYKPLAFQTVTWQPHADNNNFALAMIVKRVAVIYAKNRYRQQRILLELESDSLTQDIVAIDETAPTATTESASLITTTTATLNGLVNPNGSLTTISFEYGLTTAYGTTVGAAQSPLNSSTITTVSKAITGLAANTIYNYRVKAINAQGTTYGSNMSFTTLAT